MRTSGVVVALGVPAAFVATAVALGLASTVTASGATTSASNPRSTAPSMAPNSAGRSGAGLRPAVASAQVTFRISTSDPVAFITIDDGIVKDPDALAFVRSQHLPVTAFVTAWTIKDQGDYFRSITQWGSIQNHSATHASLTDPATDLDHETCYASREIARDTGARPWMYRPPYGAGYDRADVHAAVAQCGMDAIVMWDATLRDGVFKAPTGHLRRGDIVLLHFTPTLAADLAQAVAQMQADGLRPADLAAYLPAPEVPAASASATSPAPTTSPVTPPPTLLSPSMEVTPPPSLAPESWAPSAP